MSEPRTAANFVNGRDPEIAKAIMEPNGKQYRKTALVWAFPLSEEVTIDTPEGVMRAGIGDYLASDDPPTHLWPVRRNVFKATYVEAAAQAEGSLSDRGTLEQACIAVVGPWFDESHEAGKFAPIVLAQRILREYDARLADEEHSDAR